MSAAQILRQAEALKPAAGDLTKGSTDAWVSRQNLQDLYQKLLIFDLEFALDKKVEQDLWNHAFKNQITVFQNQAKDKLNPKRGEMQATLQLFLDTASGFYLQLLQEMCSAFRIDLPMRRRPQNYGIVKDIRSGYSRVKAPKKSSSLYICQYCLVHLGDIARYRQQVEQAQTYYRHAAWVVPYNGQPYNQLAILEAAKGNKLSTVFYYIRSAAVKHPFPVACTNLEKFYTKISKDTKPELKGKLSMSEMVTGFLQFHALLHHCTDLVKAQTLSEKLCSSFPSHLMSSFSAYQLVQMVAINLFALHHAKRKLEQPSSQWGAGGDGGQGDADPVIEEHVEEEELSSDEKKSYVIILELTLHMLEAMVQFSPKQESKLKEHHTLAALKLILDCLCTEKDTLEHPCLDKFTAMWQHLAKVLNNLQFIQLDKSQFMEIKKYTKYPLPEDRDLQCFLPLTKAQSDYSFQNLPLDGMPEYAETKIRCRRIVERGLWIAEEFPSLNFLNVQKFSSGRLEFSTGLTPVLQLKVTSGDTDGLPEKRPPVRQQNVAIQAIIQNKARQSHSMSSVTPQNNHQVHTEGKPETSKSEDFSTGSIKEKDSEEKTSATNESQEKGNTQDTDSKQTTTILKPNNSTNKTPPNSRRPSKLAVTFETPIKDKDEDKGARQQPPCTTQQILTSGGKQRGEKGRGGSSNIVNRQQEGQNGAAKGSPGLTPPDAARSLNKNLQNDPSRNYYIGVPLTSTEMKENQNNTGNSSVVSQQPQTSPSQQLPSYGDNMHFPMSPFTSSAFGPISFAQRGGGDPAGFGRARPPPPQSEGGAGDPEAAPQAQQQRMRHGGGNPAVAPYPGMMLGPQLPFSMWGSGGGGGGGGANPEFRQANTGVAGGVRPRPRLTLVQQRHLLQMQHMQALTAAAHQAGDRERAPMLCPPNESRQGRGPLEAQAGRGGELMRQGPWNPTQGIGGQIRNAWGQGSEVMEDNEGNDDLPSTVTAEDFSPRPGGAVRGAGSSAGPAPQQTPPQYPTYTPPPPRPIGPSANQLPQPQFTQQQMPPQQSVRMNNWETRQPPSGQFENLHPTIHQLFQTSSRQQGPPPQQQTQNNVAQSSAAAGKSPPNQDMPSMNTRGEHFHGMEPQHPEFRRLPKDGGGTNYNGMDIPKPGSPSGSSSGMGSLFSTTPEARGQTPPNSGIYSLFSNSPWSLPLTKPEANGQSSPFGSSTASNRTTPEQHSVTEERSPSLAPGQPRNTGFGMPGSPLEQMHQWQVNSPPEMMMARTPVAAPNVQQMGGPPDLMANNMQALWSGPSALARLLESQRPQKRDPH